MKRAYLVPVINDLFDVANRLHEIDAGYVVYFNKLQNQFEVHNHSQKGSSLALVVPFDELDARTVELARKTRVENAEKLFEEMEKANQLAENNAVSRAVDRCAKEMKL